jgi:uncharacterized protein YbbC (DUF1343 family)/CubicO group peptidase (beta-lactamase class C family)
MQRVFVVFFLAVAILAAQPFAGAPKLDRLLDEAIKQGQIPGAVLLVGHEGRIVHRKAYGNRVLEPATEPMSPDTVFDCASLTKVVATTSAVMKLFEEGRFRLNDRVSQHIPDFQGGYSEITIRHLLTHFSGLRPDLDLKPAWSGYDTGIKLALIDKPTEPPGVRFVYSDINFILLGELVRRLSGQPVSDYAREHIFLPLGMKDTMFQPPADLKPRIAPTERAAPGGAPLRGVVHDETTRFMGGVAGHAGMFSTADDLARFCQMMLNRGELGGVRLFSPLTVRKFTTPQSPPDQPVLRGLGWDLDSPYSGTRGELFALGSYGHTGFTGTSLWIDPATRTYVILLANSVHPSRRPAITPLRALVATVTAAALGVDAPDVALTGYNETMAGVRRAVARNGRTLTGLDVMAQENFRAFEGKRIGLITNHTGIDREGRRNVDVMRQAGVQVAALFSPEHGFAGTEDRDGIADTTDPATGIRVFSLYGATRRPTPEMLRGIDALVFDIQDIGVRFYTYETTMAYAMEAAAEAGIPFFVLDRPNPLTGVHVEGPLLDPQNESFVGYRSLPLRHGMTMGELARLFNVEGKIGASLTIVPMKDWQRGDWFDCTNLPWVNPSPNIRGLNAALLYPGLALIEYSKNYSVGRGTDAPFEQVGAAFIRGPQLASYLAGRHIPGVRVYPTRFAPASSNLAGSAIDGLRFIVTGREAFHSARLGIELAAALLKLYPKEIELADSRKLIGAESVILALQAGEDPRSIVQRLADDLEPFLEMREKHLIYR